jgi:hypothetical protein
MGRRHVNRWPGELHGDTGALRDPPMLADEKREPPDAGLPSRQARTQSPPLQSALGMRARSRGVGTFIDWHSLPTLSAATVVPLPVRGLYSPCSHPAARGHGRRDRPRAGTACDDYRTVGLVIEARIERVVEPPVGGDAAAVRHGVTGLEQIDDDGAIRAAAGQNAADRSRQPKPAPLRDEFLQRRASRGALGRDRDSRRSS